MPDRPAVSIRRLKKRPQFLRAARGNRIARRGFVLQAVPVAEPDAGVGYTVTKKMGNAPERNRIKRRLRAAAEAVGSEFEAGFDYVLIGRREALEEPFEALVRGLGKAIRRINTSGPQRTEKQ